MLLIIKDFIDIVFLTVQTVLTLGCANQAQEVNNKLLERIDNLTYMRVTADQSNTQIEIILF